MVLLGRFLGKLYWPNNLLLHMRPGLCCAHSSSMLGAGAGAGAESLASHWGKQSQGLGNSGHEPQPGLGKQQLCLEHCTWRFLSHPKDKQKGKLGNGLSLMGNTPRCPSSLSHSLDGRHRNVRVSGTNQCE